MRAFTITGPGRGEVTDIPTPQPGLGEAVIRTARVGICGTDYHIFAGHFRTTYPLVSGHEFTGTIEALGDDAGEWREGDRVAVDPTLYCGTCYRCLRRQANHCDRWGALGDTTNGALAEFVKVPIRNLYRVEDHETFEDATFTEPLACVVWGIERLRTRPGDRALVFGAGPVGCLMAQMLTAAQMADVVVVDIEEVKLLAARQSGAATFLSGPELRQQLEERTRGRGFDVVVDCTGVPEVIESTFLYAGPNARIMFFGVAPPSAEIQLRPFEVYHHDWEIIGSMAINYTFQQARDLIASGRVSVRPLLSRIAQLADVPDILGNPKDPSDLKVMIAPNDAALAAG